MTSNQYGYNRSAFAQALRRHMETWPGFAGSRPPCGPTGRTGYTGDYRNLAGKAAKADSVALHDYARHLPCSQVFALNLFLPFREGKRERLSRRVSDLVGDELTIDRVVFEWAPPGHLLGKIDGERPRSEEHATAVDVVLWGWLPNG